MFDVSTLVSIAGIFQLLLTAVIFVTWRKNPSTVDVRAWVVCYLLVSTSSFLFLVRDILPETFAIIVPNYLLLAGIYALLYGTRQYLGVKNFPIIQLAIISIMFLAVFFFFTYVEPDRKMRTFVIVPAVAFIFLLSAWDTLSRSNSETPARYFYGTNCILLSFTQFFLIASVIVSTEGQSLLSATNTFAQIYGVLNLITMVFMCISIILLVTERLSSNLKTYSERDSLTNVFNRRIFLTLLEKSLHSMKRNKTSMALVSIDLDHFKKVNDTYGHNAGDDVLKHFVKVAQECLRLEDIFGRLGGEEFSIFLPNTNQKNAAIIAERVRTACESTSVSCGSMEIKFTASLGLAIADDFHDMNTLIDHADKAMYLAKETGRNKVVTYT